VVNPNALIGAISDTPLRGFLRSTFGTGLLNAGIDRRPAAPS